MATAGSECSRPPALFHHTGAKRRRSGLATQHCRRTQQVTCQAVSAPPRPRSAPQRTPQPPPQPAPEPPNQPQPSADPRAWFAPLQHVKIQLSSGQRKQRTPWLTPAAGGAYRRMRKWAGHLRKDGKANPTGLAVTWLGTSSGEGTLYQLAMLDLPLWRITHIFITHMHGDHCWGIPMLIYNRLLAFAAARRAPESEEHNDVDQALEPLHIFGPPGLIEFVTQATMLASSGVLNHGNGSTQPHTPHISVTEWCTDDSTTSEELHQNGIHFTLTRQAPEQANEAAAALPEPQVTPKAFSQVALPGPDKANGLKHLVERMPLVDGLTWSVTGPLGYNVRAAQLSHRVPCWGYVFQEPAASTPEQLRSGRHSRKVCLLGDTCDSRAIARIAHGCDLLSHEATFLHVMSRKAMIATHSTGLQAGRFAHKVQAKQLVLTHFSGRYTSRSAGSEPVPVGCEKHDKGDDEDEISSLHMLRREAMHGAHKQVPVACAFDGLTWRIPPLPVQVTAPAQTNNAAAMLAGAVAVAPPPGTAHSNSIEAELYAVWPHDDKQRRATMQPLLSPQVKERLKALRETLERDSAPTEHDLQIAHTEAALDLLVA